MTLPSTTIKIVAALAAIGAAAAAFHYFKPAQERKAVPEAKEVSQPGVIRFAPNSPQLSSLKLVAVSEERLPVADPVNARIAYDENATTRIASPVGGRIIGLRAEVGDRVQRDAVLAEIDSPELATAEADWRKAQADELRKKLAFERARTLFDGDVLPRKDYESAAADHQQAKAETTRAMLRMKNLHASGRGDGRFVLKTPIAGIVADKQINPGMEVRPDLANPLFVITDIRRLWVVADVPERSAAQIHPGQAVSIETDAYPEQKFAARVDLVGLALDPVTRRLQVRCSIENAERKLKPEMFARVAFLADEGSKKGISLPNTSLFIEGMYSYVFVEKQPGTFEKRRVNVRVRGHDRSFVDAGLSSGERVVSEGAFLLNAEVGGDAQ